MTEHREHGEMPGGVDGEESMYHKHLQGCGRQKYRSWLYCMWETLVSLVLCVYILVVMGEGLMGRTCKISGFPLHTAVSFLLPSCYGMNVCIPLKFIC